MGYWEDRAIEKDKYFDKLTGDYYKNTLLGYKELALSYRENLAKFYGMHGSNLGNKVVVLPSVMDEYLGKKELIRFRKSLTDYTPATEDLRMKEMTATLLRRKKIKRIDKLTWDTEKNISDMTKDLTLSFTGHLSSSMASAYKFNINSYESFLQRSFKFGELAKKRIEVALSYPWSGANYSSRLWNNKDALAKLLNQTIVRGFIEGSTLKQMSNEIAQKTGKSYKLSERLVRGETTHIIEEANKKAAEDVGVEFMEISSILDARSVHYDDFNGKRFTLGSPEEAFLTPPLAGNPNCRCTLIPVLD